MSLDNNAFNLKLYYGPRVVSAAPEQVRQWSVKFREETISAGFTLPLQNWHYTGALSGWPAGYSQRKADCVSQTGSFQHSSPRLRRYACLTLAPLLPMKNLFPEISRNLACVSMPSTSALAKFSSFPDLCFSL